MKHEIEKKCEQLKAELALLKKKHNETVIKRRKFAEKVETLNGKIKKAVAQKKDANTLHTELKHAESEYTKLNDDLRESLLPLNIQNLQKQILVLETSLYGKTADVDSPTFAAKRP